MLNLFKNISISLKLAIGSAVTLLLTAIMALAGWYGVQTLVEKIHASQSLSNTLTRMNDASRAKAVYIAQPLDANAKEVLALIGGIQQGLADDRIGPEKQQVTVARSAVDQFSSSFSGLARAQSDIKKHDAEIAEARVAIRNVGDKVAESARVEEATFHQASQKQRQIMDRANQLALKIGDVVEFSVRALVSLSASSAAGNEAAITHLEAVRRIAEELFDSSVAPQVDEAAEAFKTQIGKTLELLRGLGRGDNNDIPAVTSAIQTAIDKAKLLKETFFTFIAQSNTERDKIDREALKARTKASLGGKFSREAMEAASELGDYHAEPGEERQKAIEKRLVALKNLNGAVKGMTGLDASETIEKLSKAFAGLVGAQKALRNNLAATGESEALVSQTLNDLVTQNKIEANGIANQAVISILVATFISLAFAIVLTIGLWLLISRPLRTFTQTTLRVAKGDHDVDLDAAGRKDEIGQLISAMGIFRDSLIENQRLEAKQRQAQLAQNERQQRIDALITVFRNEMREVLHAVGQNVEELQSTANGMAKLAEGNALRSASVADASRNASSNVGAVAAASEEMAASIEEISRQASEAMTTVKTAAITASEANTKVTGLAEAAQTIGEVISLISDIAGQTNLLALNATIEAARAGEAGKGFAVVASEVKNLATQTSKATERIAAQVAGIQSETTETVKTIGLITTTMDKVNQYTNVIAAAVSEQGDTTGEISRNIQEAAERTRSVAEIVSETTASSIQTRGAAEQVLKASANVHDRARALKNRIDLFLEEVAAA